MTVTMDMVVSLAKRRGFVYSGSEIYGGLANSWDYGPLGVELKNNIKQAWWRNFVQDRNDVVGLDSAILMNPQIWQASGHLAGFSDPLVDCRKCKTRHRADKLIEAWLEKKGQDPTQAAKMKEREMEAFLVEQEIRCPHCGNLDYTGIRQFNLMFKTFVGVTEDSAATVYLRPETAQGIFVNFKNVQTTSRKKVPFGIGQIGKSFRNEITPGNFIFRTREFEQMELEFFCQPEESRKWFDHWKTYCHEWLLALGMQPDNIRLRDHEQAELSHYSQATTD
ncbi:MAG: glycine--tRNA ligase, partial [Deltaproteobacteria bacterium]|nr:glycine--tRNA ligase [Deltaproteobacteria bacterium]